MVSANKAVSMYHAPKSAVASCSVITVAKSHVPAVVLPAHKNAKTGVFTAHVRRNVARPVRHATSLARGSAITTSVQRNAENSAIERDATNLVGNN